MTYLITGGGGFIGAHLVDQLLNDTSSEIIIYDDFSTGAKSNIDHLAPERIRIFEGDIRNKKHIDRAVSRANFVYHLAAAVGVKRVVNNPLESLQINLRGTENVLEAATQHNIPVFIASSSEVYGKNESTPFEESDDRLLGPTEIPRWGYATAKAMDEHLAFSYHETLDLPVVIGRYFNIVGPRQTGQYGMVIPRFVEQALSNEPLTVYGDGTQKRSFTHVRDAVELTHALLETPAAHGDVVNIGTSDSTSINELAQRVIELTESDSRIQHVPFDEVYGDDFEEPSQREPDVMKLREFVGWVPEADLDRILLDVIAERQNEETVAADD